MTDSTAYQRLMMQFMEQWQRQMSGVASDRELVQSLLDMVRNPYFSAMSSHDGDGNDGDGEEKSTYKNTSAGATPASGAGDVSVAELARRLAYCEARISHLEGLLESSAATTTRKSAGGKTASSTKSDSKKTKRNRKAAGGD